MEKWISIFLCSLLGFSCGKPCLRATSQRTTEIPQPIETNEQSSRNQHGANNPSPYQVGDRFNREIIDIHNYSRHLNLQTSPSLKNIVKVGNATGIILGIYERQAVIITSKHTIPSDRICQHGVGLSIPILSETKKYPCAKLLASWDEIDSSMVLFDGFSDEEIISLQKQVKTNLFSNRQEEAIAMEKSFLTAGFGRHENANQKLTLNADQDCKWLAKNQNYSKHSDPDSLNPLPYQVWSVPSSCDISHGDSGSPLIEIETGKIYGVFWTGKMPKTPKVQSSQSLWTLAFSSFESLYRELNLVVPASVIQEVIKNNPEGDSCSSWNCEKNTQIIQSAIELF